jgi:hypothetical protein
MPIRSLTEPPGFIISSLATTWVRMPRVSALNFTKGVLPNVSMMFARISVPVSRPFLTSADLGGEDDLVEVAIPAP